MVEMHVGQQQNVDFGSIESEILAVGVDEVVAAMEQAAVDEEPASSAFKQVTRSRNFSRRTVKTRPS